MNELYQKLQHPRYSREDVFEKVDLGENMFLINQAIFGWWKPRFIINEDTQEAYVWMNSMTILQMVTDDDIDWDSLKGLPETAIDRAHRYNALFPSQVWNFHNGEAIVTWQLNPDGRYYEDEDGFGMTNDVEIEIRGKINKQCQIIEKFHYSK